MAKPVGNVRRVTTIYQNLKKKMQEDQRLLRSFPRTNLVICVSAPLHFFPNAPGCHASGVRDSLPMIIGDIVRCFQSLFLSEILWSIGEVGTVCV